MKRFAVLIERSGESMPVWVGDTAGAAKAAFNRACDDFDFLEYDVFLFDYLKNRKTAISRRIVRDNLPEWTPEHEQFSRVFSSDIGS